MLSRNTKRLEDELQTPYDKGRYRVFYNVCYCCGCYSILLSGMHHSRYLLPISNVDIVANLLAINFPDYFIKWYSVYNDSLRGYLSFNIAGVVALAGIFTFGLNVKERSRGRDGR